MAQPYREVEGGMTWTHREKGSSLASTQPHGGKVTWPDLDLAVWGEGHRPALILHVVLGILALGSGGSINCH